MTRFVTFSFLLFFFSSCYKDDLSEIRDQIDDLDSRLSDAEVRLDSIENDLVEIRSNINTLKEDGKFNSAEYNELSRTVGGLGELLELFQLDIDSLASEHNALELLLISVQSSSETFAETSEFKSLSSSLQNLTAGLDSLFNNNFNINDSLGVLQNSIELLQNNITIVKDQIALLTVLDTYQELTGAVEKGGFLSGSQLFLFEIDSLGAQTGRSFITSIDDNFGSFSLNVKNLKGKLCRAIATGFYYNEVLDRNSTSQISLSGIVRIDSGEVINVNVLTHLERPRVEYLLSQGLDYDSAKITALTDVLGMFGIENPGLNRSEKIGLIGDLAENDILLSVSVLLQGFRKEGELTEMLAKISNDLRIDGQLSDNAVGNLIETHLYYMERTKIVSQVKAQYEGVYPVEVLSGIQLNNLVVFEEKTDFQRDVSLISFPYANNSGYVNILSDDINSLKRYDAAVIAASLTDGTSLKIEIVDENGDSPAGIWIATGDESSWRYELRKGDGGLNEGVGIFETNTPGLNSVVFAAGFSGTTYQVIFYEKGGITETRRKTIVVVD